MLYFSELDLLFPWERVISLTGAGTSLTFHLPSPRLGQILSEYKEAEHHQNQQRCPRGDPGDDFSRYLQAWGAAVGAAVEQKRSAGIDSSPALLRSACARALSDKVTNMP